MSNYIQLYPKRKIVLKNKGKIAVPRLHLRITSARGFFIGESLHQFFAEDGGGQHNYSLITLARILYRLEK